MSDEKSALGDASKKILDSMKKKTFSGEETIAWIKNIKENIATAPVIQQKQHLTMLSCMDTLFDHFQRYAYELAHAETFSIDVRCERPNFSSHVQRCYGYISSSDFGLVLEGEPERIRAFIVPAAFVAGFEGRRNDFMSFMELLGRADSGGIFWEIEGGTIGFDHLPIIAKKLFARLVRVSRGEASELEPFMLNLAGALKPAPPADVAESMTTVVNRVFDRNKNSISTSCFLLVREIDAEIEALTKIGVKVLQSQNLELMPRVMKRTESLRQFRQMAQMLVGELGDLFADE